MSDLRWDYDCECWVCWHGPVLVGRVERKAGREWEAWALGGKTMTLPTLSRAQWWVEMWAKESTDA
jgi:hypothetical protein